MVKAKGGRLDSHTPELLLARYSSHYDVRSRDFALDTILTEIRTGNTSVIESEKTAELAGGNSLRHATDFAQSLLAKGNKAAYAEIKKGLPAFMAQGRSSEKSRQIDTFSGYVIVEYDDVEDVPFAMYLASQNPYVRAAFVSMSGTGIKIIGRATPVPDAETYKRAWFAFALMFEEIGTPDPTGMRVNQPNALTYDPNLYKNPDALAFEWDTVDDEDIEDVFPKSETTWEALDALPSEYQVALENMEWKDNGSGRTRLPCFSGSHEGDGWESSSNAMVVFRQPNGDLKFHCHKCPSNSASTLFSGEVPKPNQNPKNTHIPYQPTQEDIRSLIANAPPVEVRETPSFRHFSTEERALVRQVLETSPDAGWHGSTPVWTPKYEYLHPLTNKFAMNGQPSEVEKRRVWSTLFGVCPACDGMTAKWVDRYTLEAGLYCDGCHKDYSLGSYLELELNRKLPNSIISDFQGFLGDNPDFIDFRLFEPGMLTHLGSGMGTGKTTEIVNILVSLAQQELGKGIIVVPRIALAQQLAYQLRRRYGHDAWGLWTEGSSKGEKFVGTYGAIVCLPSLPQVVREASEEHGIENLYIAIDELDFGYELLSLDITQATAVKKILRDALQSIGIVVAGQTESTLSLEAFAEEIGAEAVQGFYNTAEPAEGHVLLKQHAADTNINAFIASGIDDITELLRNGQHVYSFCASRRDGEILAETFSAENPLVYSAYTRGEYRAHELLRFQRLTDTNLFIGTSAAGVGISFLDKHAVTVVMGGLIFGSRHANMAAQKSIRDRGRRGVMIHTKDYNFSLPVRPTENRDVSLYHEALKQALNTDMLSVPEHAVTKIAAAQALASLADIQFETFLRYHLGVVGNMEVVVEAPAAQPKDVAEAIAGRRSEIRSIENELKKENAKAILKTVLDDDTDTALLTSSEIRKQRNQGKLSTDGTLAHELANEAARAVGWDDVVSRFYGQLEPFQKPPDPFEGIFDADDIDVALRLVDRNFDFEGLTRKRAGYLAVKAPLWTAHRFEMEVSRADAQLVMAGLGVELTAVKDYRLLGELLQTLLDRLIGQVFDTQSLTETVNSVLATKASTGKNFGQELRSGALGASEYRKARFLHCAEDAQMVVDWVSRFISEWYPARFAKREDSYALQPDAYAELYLKSFERWLHHQSGVLDGTEIQLDIFESIEMPESNAEQKEIARGMRAEGETLKAIAAELGIKSHATIKSWCEGITPKKRTKATRKSRQKESEAKKQMKQKRDAEVFRRYDAGETQQEIKKTLKIGLATVNRILNSRDF